MKTKKEKTTPLEISLKIKHTLFRDKIELNHYEERRSREFSKLRKSIDKNEAAIEKEINKLIKKYGFLVPIGEKITGTEWGKLIKSSKINNEVRVIGDVISRLVISIEKGNHREFKLELR